MRRALTLTAFLCLALSSTVVHGAVGQSPATDASSLQMLKDALLAQVENPGGCGTMDSVELRPSAFFEDVTIAMGRCVAEHGDTLHTVAARDRHGTVYVLNSPSAFRFLLRRHPPNIGSRTLDYVRDALVFSGLLYAGATRVVSEGTLPADVPGRVRRQVAQDSTISRSGPGQHLRLLAHGPRGVQEFAVTLWPGGSISAESRWLWTRPGAATH